MSYMVRLFFVFITLFISSGVAATEFTFYSLNSKPASYQDGGRVVGYYADVLRRVGEELGLGQVKINMGPYPRIAHALNENSNGIVVTCLFPSSAFQERVHQPTSVGTFETGIISLKNFPLSWDSINGKRVATVRGASKVYGDKFHKLVQDGSITLVSVTDYAQAMKMLGAGRIDGFASNLGPTLAQVKSQKLDISDPLVITEKVSMITVSVAPGTADGDKIVTQIGEIVDKMRASGEIQDIIEKYLPDAKQPR